ncbi:MAG: YfiR family protein [Methylovulum sp.]|uniref:YfiR family protein n=1 Tax=Methylovulum sp. TaxID=1916980 RepID=UPI00260C25E4|nr:YfiR family protein [Methylovulum sp.]MDD2724270.1 YfiR family protein [Methylovulum sp.]MDD5122997.1 YfiR family protein [Methylovulum sp.]
MLKATALSARFTLALLMAVLVSAPACAESGGEAAVKTAFLFNFFKFIEWPETTSLRTFNLCTTENDHLGDSLVVLDNKTLFNKPMVVRRGVVGEELKKCHMVFISTSDHTGYFEEIINKLKGFPIVTVSDQPGFINHGGMIGFVQDDNRLSFEINLDTAKANAVHISAKLLKLAKNVNLAK